MRLNERIARAMTDVVIGPTRAYRGLPEPATRNLNEQPPVVNNLLLYWIQHGRIHVVPAIERLDGQDRALRRRHQPRVRHDPVGDRFKHLPFLDRDLVRCATASRCAPPASRSGRRRALYFVGLAAPRGPQLPVYSTAELVVRMLRLRPGAPLRARRALRGDRRAGHAHRHRAPDLEPADEGAPRRLDTLRPVTL